MTASLDQEIRLGIWKIHILHHAETREVWGQWLIEELREHGHVLSPGTLYPALAKMVRNGWLRRARTSTSARARQGLRLTAAGRRLLAALRRDVVELHEEVVVEHRDRERAKEAKKEGKKKRSNGGRRA